MRSVGARDSFVNGWVLLCCLSKRDGSLENGCEEREDALEPGDDVDEVEDSACAI